MNNSEQQTQGGLVKSFGLYTAFMLVVSSIIGSGVFKKVAPMSAELMSPTMVLICWVLAGVITLCGALTNAEVAGIIADSGGQYVYFRKMYGRMFSFFFGWACFAVIQSATIASISYVFAESFNAMIPLPTLGPDLAALTIPVLELKPFDNFGVKLVSVGLITLLTSVNIRGVQYGGLVSNVFTAAIVVSIFSIILLGLSISEGSLANIQTDAPGYTQLKESGGLFSAMFSALLMAFWAYEGWNSLGFLGAEIKDPNRNIPLALMFGVLFVMVTYVFINFTYLYVMPMEEMLQVAKTTNSIAGVEVVKKFLGEYGVIAISILILVATFGCVNTSIMTASRIYFAMAQKGVFFQAAGESHPKFKTPANSLLIQAFWSSVLVISGSFDMLTDMLIFAAFIFYGAGALGVFVLRRKMPDVPRPYKAFGYPVIPALFIAFCVVLVVQTLINKPGEAGIGLFLILTGLPFYFYWSNKNKGMDKEE